MPPPQFFLASRIRGFVCRSCLLELRASQHHSSPWTSRSITLDNGLRAKGAADQASHSQYTKQTEPIVRYFEEHPGGERREIHDDPEEETFMESLESTIRDLKKHRNGSRNSSIEDMDGNRPGLGDIMEGALPPHDIGEGSMTEAITSEIEDLQAQMHRLESTFQLGNMSEEDRLKIRQDILKLSRVTSLQSASRPPLSATDMSQSDPMLDTSKITTIRPGPFVIPPGKFSTEYGRHIKNLNLILSQCWKSMAGQKRKRRISSNHHREAWRSYLMCRKVLFSAPNKVPVGFWSMLFKVFGEESSENIERLAHIHYLGRDMIKAGVALQEAQMLLYIEATFIEGYRNVALQEWEAARRLFGTATSSFKDYWELGVRMFCQIGRPDQALHAVETLLNAWPEPTTFRILIPVIQAYLASNTESAIQMAWALYIRLRVNLDSEIKMEDYDAITSIFLTANQPDFALGAFKDMMLTGDKSAAQEDSTALYRITTGVTDGLNLIKIGNRELTWEDSRTLATLPNKYNNRFFFGKWLKKLIGEGELDAAVKVVSLMHERTICPDAKHINGLIGAWLRAGTARNQKLAEDMAWRMIKSRLEFVEGREARCGLEGPLRETRLTGKPDHKPIFLFPRATIETFSVLIEHYRRRQRHDLMQDIFAALKKARVPPNTFFMNQLLMVHSQSPKHWAWDTYTSLVREYGVRPDFDTYSYLWHLVKKSVDPVLNSRTSWAKDFSNFVAPRFLFAEMAKRSSNLKNVEKLPRELYDSIILSFSLANDQPGTAVALRALQRLFNMFPTEDTVRTIVLQLSRVGLTNEAGLPPRRLNVKKSTQVKERVTQVTKVLEAFKKQRAEALLEQGIVFEELQGDARLEESLIVLSDLLRYVAQARLSGEIGLSSVMELSKVAAEAMGVPECAPWVAQNDEMSE